MKSLIGRSIRATVAVTGAALAIGCTDATPTGTRVTPTEAVLSRVPLKPSPRFAFPDKEYVEVCLNGEATMPEEIIAEVMVDIGDNGTTDQVYRYRLLRGECKDVWVHGGKTLDRVYVVVAPHPQVELGYIIGMNEAGAVGWSTLTEGNTARGVHVGGTMGGLVTFYGYHEDY